MIVGGFTVVVPFTTHRPTVKAPEFIVYASAQRGVGSLRIVVPSHVAPHFVVLDATFVPERPETAHLFESPVDAMVFNEQALGSTMGALRLEPGARLELTVRWKGRGRLAYVSKQRFQNELRGGWYVTTRRPPRTPTFYAALCGVAS